jgi:hypothetical protein
VCAVVVCVVVVVCRCSTYPTSLSCSSPS